jgi:hypothetical protein
MPDVHQTPAQEKNVSAFEATESYLKGLTLPLRTTFENKFFLSATVIGGLLLRSAANQPLMRTKIIPIFRFLGVATTVVSSALTGAEIIERRSKTNSLQRIDYEKLGEISGNCFFVGLPKRFTIITSHKSFLSHLSISRLSDTFLGNESQAGFKFYYLFKSFLAYEGFFIGLNSVSSNSLAKLTAGVSSRRPEDHHDQNLTLQKRGQ